MKNKIISISGFRGSGKDTVGAHLQLDHGFESVSFAHPLKQTVCAMFGWAESDLAGKTPESRAWRTQPDPYWSEKLGRPFTPLDAMTEVGHDLIRGKFLDSIWLNRMEQHLTQHDQTNWVITDARFTPELQLIRDQGGITVWVKRDPFPTWYDTHEWLQQQPAWCARWIKPFLKDLRSVHVSETEWLDWSFDHVIENDQDLNHLFTQVDVLMQQINHSM